MHIHVSLLASLGAFLGVLVWGFFWRVIALKFSHTSVGQAMAFIY